MNRYYECHITIKPHEYCNREKIAELVAQTDWKFSAIDGDPTLGDKVFCYATRHYKNSYPVVDIIRWMKEAASFFSKGGADVIRKKVEVIVFDERAA